jgi:hypothetical protein
MPESPNVIINRKNASVVLHFTANTANVVIVGNSSVSNIAKPGEIVNGASIAQAIFGSPSGNAAHWIVKRGANTVLVLDSTAALDFAGTGMAIGIHATANLSVELVGSTTGFLTLELQKLNSRLEYLAE